MIKISEEREGCDDIITRYRLPVTKEIVFSSHRKSITCIGIESAGKRCATGSMDYETHLWDFGGMTHARHPSPFRTIEIDDGYPMVALSYSPTGDRFLAVTGSSQPKIYDREGIELIQFVKGDMYVMDMSHTKGHTHTTTGGIWHPNEKNIVWTSSLDGTIREWDLNGKTTFNKLICKSTIKCRNLKGKRCGVLSCSMNTKNNSLLIASTEDAQIHVYDTRKYYTGKPASQIKNAHATGSHISCARFANDSLFLCASRGSDDMLKIWDLRKLKTAVKEIPNVEMVHPNTNLVFSPLGTSIAVGTSVPHSKGLCGSCRLYDVHTPNLLEPIHEMKLDEDVSGVCVEWHPKLDQIFVGTSSGQTKVYFDPTISKKGVVEVGTKAKQKRKTIESGVRLNGAGKIYNPHALPMYREELSLKRQKIKDRKDPVKSHMPEKPVTGPGSGGRVNTSATFTQFYMKDHIKKTFREEDPREALLKFAEKASSDPKFVARAYEHTQPDEKIDERYKLAKETLEGEREREEEEEKNLLQP